MVDRLHFCLQLHPPVLLPLIDDEAVAPPFENVVLIPPGKQANALTLLEQVNRQVLVENHCLDTAVRHEVGATKMLSPRIRIQFLSPVTEGCKPDIQQFGDQTRRITSTDIQVTHAALSK